MNFAFILNKFNDFITRDLHACWSVCDKYHHNDGMIQADMKKGIIESYDRFDELLESGIKQK